MGLWGGSLALREGVWVSGCVQLGTMRIEAPDLMEKGCPK